MSSYEEVFASLNSVIHLLEDIKRAIGNSTTSTAALDELIMKLNHIVEELALFRESALQCREIILSQSKQ